MDKISKEMAYLKGLAEGMKLAEKSDEGKMIEKLINVLEEASAKLERVADRVADLSEQAELADTDINELWNELDDLRDSVDSMGTDDLLDVVDDDDTEPFYDDDDDDDLFDAYDDDDDLFEIQCPECGDDVVVDFEMLDEENNIVCPHCHQKIDLLFDIPDEDDDDDDDEDDDDEIND